MRETFRKLAERTAKTVGTPAAFLMSVLVVVVWGATGPLFGYSDSWQLVINTGTTIVTFLMVFLIQATQNRDTEILNLKLDEMLRALKHARTEFACLNDMSDEDLRAIHDEFTALSAASRPLLGNQIDVIQSEMQRRHSRRARNDRTTRDHASRPHVSRR